MLEGGKEGRAYVVLQAWSIWHFFLRYVWTCTYTYTYIPTIEMMDGWMDSRRGIFIQKKKRKEKKDKKEHKFHFMIVCPIHILAGHKKAN